jgi:hypothetical protein
MEHRTWENHAGLIPDEQLARLKTKLNKYFPALQLKNDAMEELIKMIAQKLEEDDQCDVCGESFQICECADSEDNYPSGEPYVHHLNFNAPVAEAEQTGELRVNRINFTAPPASINPNYVELAGSLCFLWKAILQL